MTIGLLSAALYMGLQMFVKPYRSYRSQMLADGLMLMLLLFLLLGEPHFRVSAWPADTTRRTHCFCSPPCDAGVNSQLKGAGDLDAASITVLTTLGILFAVFCGMMAAEMLEYTEATSKRDNEARVARNQAVVTLVEADDVRATARGRHLCACAHSCAITWLKRGACTVSAERCRCCCCIILSAAPYNARRRRGGGEWHRQWQPAASAGCAEHGTPATCT